MGADASSPDIIERIESFLDTASELRPKDQDQDQVSGPEDRVLDCNQVLVNEYQADQGISVSPPSTQDLMCRA